jgi:hypothetical protein
MLDYRELSLNPYHLNKNEQTEEEKVAAEGPPNFNWWDLFGAGASGITDYYKYQGPTQAQLQQSIDPLEAAYANLTHMAGQYRDPSSQMNVQMRNTIRGQNLEGMTDIARRAANEAVGTVDDSSTTKQMSHNAIATAIANALENYNKQSGQRLQMAADYDTKAAAAANTLASARQQNLMYQQGMREKQAGAAGDFVQNIYDWGKGKDPDLFSKTKDWFSGLFK